MPKMMARPFGCPEASSMARMNTATAVCTARSMRSHVAAMATILPLLGMASGSARARKCIHSPQRESLRLESETFIDS